MVNNTNRELYKSATIKTSNIQHYELQYVIQSE